MSASAFRLSADTIVILHAAFVAFVLVGGVLVFRWRWIAWLHVPAAVWGVLVEYSDSLCPLTPLENYLRLRSGAEAYPGDFVERYVLALLYPTRLTRGTQILLGSLALGVNVLVYWRVLQRRAR